MSDLSLKERLSKLATLSNERKPNDEGPEIDLDLADYDQTIENEWEEGARGTLVKMFQTAKLEEEFTFKVPPGCADRYVNAMRGVLVRVRKKAMKAKRPLDEFKMLVVEVKREPTYDVVTLVRTKSKSRVSKSAYDDLMGFVTAETGVK